jgi:asparagine synthase (glutamine-hydrolysing)
VKGIQKYLVRAVEKRCSTTERPIACLLSGGLDSSLIAALVNDYHKHAGLPQLETYSIGLEHSTDLKYARIVADYLGTKHTEIILTEEEFCKAIPEVIRAIESYDTTTVRASIGNYLIGKYIAKNSQAKVIFNGDGSDELLGGYLYMESAPDAIEFDRECRRLLKDIHLFDVLRSDKSISSHGLEPRTPFLDREWTQFYLSISPYIRHLPDEMEKYLLRYAFSMRQYSTREGNALLPDEILWRRKEAFSDGVSGQERSLYQILQEYCKNVVDKLRGKEMDLNLSLIQDNFIWDKNFISVWEELGWGDKNTDTVRDFLMDNIKFGLMDNSSEIALVSTPKDSEKLYYKLIFDSFYPRRREILPYYWMPKYIEATDASARTLITYNKN